MQGVVIEHCGLVGGGLSDLDTVDQQMSTVQALLLKLMLVDLLYHTQTEVECTCSVVKCTLQINCNLNSVPAVYTAHTVYYILQAAVCTYSTHL